MRHLRNMVKVVLGEAGSKLLDRVLKRVGYFEGLRSLPTERHKKLEENSGVYISTLAVG